jgi:arsenate reductase
MKKFFYLETCNTCQRIIKELNLGGEVDMREIKSAHLTEEEVDRLADKAGSYEALFSKRARKYRGLGLHEKTLSEKDFRHYLLQDYTFLKRPVLETKDRVIAGNAKRQVEEMKALT